MKIVLLLKEDKDTENYSSLYFCSFLPFCFAIRAAIIFSTIVFSYWTKHTALKEEHIFSLQVSPKPKVTQL